MSKTSEEAADFLYPLDPRRTRTDSVTAELTALSRLPARQVVARAQETHPDRRLACETRVTVVRGFLRAGNEKAADDILAALIDQLRPAVQARAQRWRVLFPADVDNAEDDAVLSLIKHIRRTDAGQEFWECNFIHCFHKRLDDAFRAVAGRRKDTLPLTSEWADGTERDRLDTLPDAASIQAFADMETREDIQALNQKVPRIAEYLFLHTQGYTDKEIAVKMNVTDRTLRYWKHKAEDAWNTLRA